MLELYPLDGGVSYLAPITYAVKTEETAATLKDPAFTHDLWWESRVGYESYVFANCKDGNHLVFIQQVGAPLCNSDDLLFLEINPVGTVSDKAPSVFCAQVPDNRVEDALKPGYADPFFNEGDFKEKDIFFIYRIGMCVLTRADGKTQLKVIKV